MKSDGRTLLPLSLARWRSIYNQTASLSSFYPLSLSTLPILLNFTPNLPHLPLPLLCLFGIPPRALNPFLPQAEVELLLDVVALACEAGHEARGVALLEGAD